MDSVCVVCRSDEMEWKQQLHSDVMCHLYHTIFTYFCSLHTAPHNRVVSYSSNKKKTQNKIYIVYGILVSADACKKRESIFLFLMMKVLNVFPIYMHTFLILFHSIQFMHLPCNLCIIFGNSILTIHFLHFRQNFSITQHKIEQKKATDLFRRQWVKL